MAFQIKEWLDRIVEHPTRRTITDTTTGVSQTVDVTRTEGEVTQEGTPLGAVTFNDLESRIATAFGEKQDTLIAGDNITIENNVISATGGSVNIADNPSGGVDVGNDTITRTLAKESDLSEVKEDLIELDDFIPKGWKVVTDTTLANTVTRLELTTLADGTSLEKFKELFVRVENSTKISSKMNSLGAKFPNVETTLYSTNDMINGTIYTIWVKNLGDSLILGMGSKNANTFNNENKTQFTILSSAITNPIPSKITLGSYIWDNTGEYGGELLAGTRVRIFAR